LAATWKPKFLITKILKSKQKKYPRTTYVTDKSKVLVERWGLLDHSYNVLVFGPQWEFAIQSRQSTVRSRGRKSDSPYLVTNI